MSLYMQSLKPNSDEYERVDQELNNNLPRAQSEAQLRRDILTIADPAVQLQRLARVYTGWDEADSTELTWWSARWLRRASRAGDIQPVSGALRSVLREIEASDLPRDEKAPYRTRILRAIRFLGGTLTDTERRFLERSASPQWDVLDREELGGARHG